MIGNSADARNQVLNEWKADLGGRTLLIEAIREGIPLRDLGFYHCSRSKMRSENVSFPRKTGEDLVQDDVGFLTSSLRSF